MVGLFETKILIKWRLLRQQFTANIPIQKSAVFRVLRLRHCTLRVRDLEKDPVIMAVMKMTTSILVCSDMWKIEYRPMDDRGA